MKNTPLSWASLDRAGHPTERTRRELGRERAGGDLSNDRSLPSALVLDVGTNVLTGGFWSTRSRLHRFVCRPCRFPQAAWLLGVCAVFESSV